MFNGDPLLRSDKKILTPSIIELVDFVTNHFTVAFNQLLREYKAVKKIMRQISKLNSLFEETFSTLNVD